MYRMSSCPLRLLSYFATPPHRLHWVHSHACGPHARESGSPSSLTPSSRSPCLHRLPLVLPFVAENTLANPSEPNSIPVSRISNRCAEVCVGVAYCSVCTWLTLAT